jgi:hypothetical protein
MGFKSKTIPYLEVVSADGRPCMGYRKKASLVAESPEPKPAAQANTKGRVINIRA